MRIRKGDTILVIAGKDHGKTGEVVHVNRTLGLVTVPGINIIKKHLKASRQNPKGGIVEIAKPMNWSKVMLICTSCGKPSRVGVIESKSGKERLCKRCQKPITTKITK